MHDDQTLSTRLGEIIGTPVYNAATAYLSSEYDLGVLLRRLDLREGFVIDEYPESEAARRIGPGLGIRSEMWRLMSKALGPSVRDIMVWHGRIRGWFAESPLKLVLFRGLKSIRDDRILPNPFAKLVVREELGNGDPILFQTEQVTRRHPPTAPAVAAAYWTEIKRRLQRRGLNLLVVLVPSQFSVYGPLVRNPPPNYDVNYLRDMERALVASDIAVVNLTELFRETAKEGLAEKRYIYWRDDTHWNAVGASLAAKQIAARLMAQQRAPSR